jgi:hypothetical protein
MPNSGMPPPSAHSCVAWHISSKFDDGDDRLRHVVISKPNAE